MFVVGDTLVGHIDIVDVMCDIFLVDQLIVGLTLRQPLAPFQISKAYISGKSCLWRYSMQYVNSKLLYVICIYIDKLVICMPYSSIFLRFWNLSLFCKNHSTANRYTTKSSYSTLILGINISTTHTYIRLYVCLIFIYSEYKYSRKSF